jgi:hypothetical protein
MVTRILTCVLLAAALTLVVSSCLVKREVQYARATKLPEECKGFMRLVDGKVTVAIISSEGGAGDVSAFDTGQIKPVDVLVNGKLTHVECSAYLVVHEQDVAQFVRNTQRLQALLKNPDIAKLAKEGGL